MTALPELKTHWRLGKRGRNEGKLYPTCLKTSSTFWWSRGLIWVTVKGTNIKHWTGLGYGYGQAERIIFPDRMGKSSCWYLWVGTGPIRTPTATLSRPISSCTSAPFAFPSCFSFLLPISISSLFPLSSLPAPSSTFFTGCQ